jgi:uncharacterized protein YndB with AHSA1/START domain
MVSIIHRVGIKAPALQVFNTLSTIDGLSGWWTENTTGTSKVGGTIEFRFQLPSGELLGSMGMEVLKLELNKQVHWRCISGPPEWIGTDIIFDLSVEEPYTVVLFTHKNWREQVEFTAHCSMKWATFLLSLKQLIETGKGKPAPNDVKIDNWN